MTNITDGIKRLSLLIPIEYRYDLLSIQFSDSYLEISRLGYEKIPDLVQMDQWLIHQFKVIRPEMIMLQEQIATDLGFSLGDIIEVDKLKICIFKISCYLNEWKVRLHGITFKKDGKLAASETVIELRGSEKICVIGKRLKNNEIYDYMFTNTSRQEKVIKFIAERKMTLGLQ
jgi:hypothetical protein